MEQTENTNKVNKKKFERRPKLMGDERIIDLLERVGTIFLYSSTSLDQNSVARTLGMDIHRVSGILKGVKKQEVK
jgi:hypothetical protein